MRYIYGLILFLVSLSLQASAWPPGLSQNVFDHCSRMGGESQCQCLVVRLQSKFTFEDMRLSSHNKLAKEALRQMIRTFNVKCREEKFKEQTLVLENAYVPRKSYVNR